ncbi:hypothetical protein [Campylobacter sp. RM16190]|uniref:hypothetical protein n=1 Tax=Campylobacter sp. RM16190 TaxID=1705727 RepID=UPI0014766610|nr:hypothetical protein [Campylobacter sp. RM16190]
MLRYAIGAISIIATGYGLKKYLENSSKIDLDINNMDNTLKNSNNISDDAKYQFASSLKDLEEALDEIYNLPAKIYTIPQEEELIKIIDSKLKTIDGKGLMFELKLLKENLDLMLNKLDGIIVKSNNYCSYSIEEQAFVLDLIFFKNSWAKT